MKIGWRCLYQIPEIDLFGALSTFALNIDACTEIVEKIGINENVATALWDDNGSTGHRFPNVKGVAVHFNVEYNDAVGAQIDLDAEGCAAFQMKISSGRFLSGF